MKTQFPYLMSQFPNLQIAAFVLLLATAVQAQAPVPVSVFTKTDPSGLVDAGTKTRQATVEKLAKELSKSKIVQVAPEAAIRVEITPSVEVEETDHLSALNNALNGAHNSDTKKVTYRTAVLHFGEYQTPLRGRNEASLAKAVENWVRENSAKLSK